MNWYYAAGGQQSGPVEEAKLQELLRTGVINAETLVWRDGMAGWRPYSEAVSGAPAMTRYGGFWIRFVARIIDGIILQVAGYIIFIPLGLALGLGSAGFLARLGDRPTEAQALAALPALLGSIAVMILLSLTMHVVYEAYFLSTRGATPGKMALGLKVIRADGGPVSVGLAIGRYFAYVLSGMTLFIGYLIAAFDAQKRSLHDHICSTRVVRVS
jgi:uncharacterized RDD family membrane protein YckC